MTTPSIAHPSQTPATPVAMPAPKVGERPAGDLSGWSMVGVTLVLLALTITVFVAAGQTHGSESGWLAFAAFVLLVLWGGRDAQPVVNAGSLY